MNSETSENPQKPLNFFQICSICKVSKNINEFYKKRNLKSGEIIPWNFCKECEKNKRKVIWHCDICDKDYLKRNKIKHQQSNVHNHCDKFKLRKGETGYRPTLENPLCSNEVEIEITDEMKSKMLEIFTTSLII